MTMRVNFFSLIIKGDSQDTNDIRVYRMITSDKQQVPEHLAGCTFLVGKDVWKRRWCVNVPAQPARLRVNNGGRHPRRRKWQRANAPELLQHRNRGGKLLTNFLACASSDNIEYEWKGRFECYRRQQARLRSCCCVICCANIQTIGLHLTAVKIYCIEKFEVT